MQLQTETKQSPKDVISKLRAEASKNQAFKAVCQGFAIRDRTRAQITIHSLYSKMLKEGFKYTRQDYVGVLKTLAGLGLGKLELSPRGKIRALKGITVKLQDIGMAAIADKDTLGKAAVTKTFTKLPIQEAVKIEKAHAKTMAGKIGMKQLNISYPAELVVRFSKNEVTTFNLPYGITARQLGSFLARLYNKDV